MILTALLFALFPLLSRAQSDACVSRCNELRRDVLTLEICKDAKKTLPRPKVGDVCSIAMEQGFSDVCVPLCEGESPTNRMAIACRAAAAEMPRPTVRRWCEHGYKTAYSKSLSGLSQTFKLDKSALSATETAPDVLPAAAAVQEQPTVVAEEENIVAIEASVKVVATIPIQLDDVEYNLTVYEHDNIETVVEKFCAEHVEVDQLPDCVADLLPTVLQRMVAGGN